MEMVRNAPAAAAAAACPAEEAAAAAPQLPARRHITIDVKESVTRSEGEPTLGVVLVQVTRNSGRIAG